MDDPRLADDFRDAFVAKWGFGEPPPAYRSAYEADLETLRFVGAADPTATTSLPSPSH